MGKLEKVAKEITGREPEVKPFSNGRQYERDYRGLLLCQACWDGEHYINRNKAINCMRGECQCPCVDKFNERHKRPAKDTSAQAVIDAPMLEIK